MTANASVSGSVLYEAESGFCETTAFSSPTRLQVVNGLNLTGLEQGKINIAPLVQYLNDGVQDVRGVYGGSFTIELMLTGSTSDTSGSVSASDLATLLGLCVGNTALSAASGTAENGGVSTATSLTVDASGTFSAGALLKAGSIGDAGGDGQFAAITSHSGTTITLLTALPAGPGDNDVIYAPEMVYPDESPATAGAVSSMRFRLLTANKQYECRGCFCTNIAFTGLSPAELPRVQLTFAVSYFNEISVTFPATQSTSASAAKPVSAGSMFINAVGTSTRATVCPRSFSLNVALQVVPTRCTDGNYDRQVISGARRIGSKATIDVVLDSEATGTNTYADLWDTDESTVVNRHILYTANSDVAFYFPNAKIVGNRPLQEDMDGLNRERVQFEALTGTTTTSALTLSSWRLAMA